MGCTEGFGTCVRIDGSRYSINLEMSNEQSEIQALIAGLRRRHHTDVIGLVAVVTGVVGLLGGVPIAGAAIFYPTAALIVPFSIAFGVYGILGATIGMLVSRLLQGSVTATDGILILAYAVMGLVAVTLWDGFTDGHSSGQRDFNYILRYGMVSIVASMVGAVTLGWLYELLAIGPFFMTPLYALSFTATAVAIGGPVFLATRAILRRRNWKRQSGGSSQSITPWVVGTTLIWFGLGTAGSALYQGFDAILTDYPHWFTSTGIEPVQILYNDALFGIGAARIQTVFGAVCMTIILTAVARSQINRQEGEE